MIRGTRTATLKARVASVQIRRLESVPFHNEPDGVELQVVQVTEVVVSEDGEPIEWLLMTSHPIETDEDIWHVIDWYRARRATEEFFKAIKTGCGYTALQHERAETLLCALAACAVVAHRLLLKHLGQHALLAAPANVVPRCIHLTNLEGVGHRTSQRRIDIPYYTNGRRSRGQGV